MSRMSSDDRSAADQLGTRAAKNELHDAFARVGKALANGHRIELLDLLAQGERSVEVLASRADISVALASAHLQALRRAGLVASRRDGNRDPLPPRRRRRLRAARLAADGRLAPDRRRRARGAARSSARRRRP